MSHISLTPIDSVNTEFTKPSEDGKLYDVVDGERYKKKIANAKARFGSDCESKLYIVLYYI
jgi:hypothetical protein